MNDILDAILYLVTIIGSVVLAFCMIEFKNKGWRKWLDIIIIIFVSFTSSAILSRYFEKNSTAYYNVILFANIFIAVVSILLTTKDNKLSAIFAIATQLNCLLLICYVANTMNRLFGPHPSLEILFRIFGFTIMSVLYRLWLNKEYRTFVDNYHETKGWILVILIPLGFFAILYSASLYPVVITLRPRYMHYIMILTALVIIATYFAIFYAFASIIEKNRIKEESDKMIAKLEYWKIQFAHQEELIDKTKRIRHDLRHHDKLLLTFLKENSIDKAIRYLEEHIEDSHLDKSIQYCLNYTINSLLGIYSDKAEKLGITIKCEVIADKEIKIDEIQAATLLANLIENAIEACDRLKDGKKFIDVEIDMTNGLKALVRNSCVKGVEFDSENFPISTKEHKSGIGTRSVASVVNQYNGFLDYTEEDGVFEARVVINV